MSHVPISLLDQLCNVPIAVVDVETTGAAADMGDRIVEIGIVRLQAGQVVDRFEQLVDPRRPMSWAASAITGISGAMLTGQPAFADITPRVTQMLGGAIVVGHNVGFDLSFIHREYARQQLDLAAEIQGKHVLDTVRIARRRFGRGGNGLARLAARLGVPQSLAHRALADAETTAGVLDRLLAPVGGWNLPLCDALTQQGGPMAIAPSPRANALPLELDEAIDSKKPVRMEYLDANQQRTHRIVEPLHVKRFRGELVLVAHCQLRQAQRTFKVHRIISVSRIDPVPEPPPAGTLFDSV